jgi:hypothetical protein
MVATSNSIDLEQAASEARTIDKHLTVAFWTSEKDADMHVERACGAFLQLAAILGYRVEPIAKAGA